ncbi:MAG: aminotransferase [Myxococcales bacterium]|nr:aminotransferase [Myxococcales bacterium]
MIPETPFTLVNIDGLIVPADQARVSVFDRGFLFGDSVYEVLRTVDGHPSFWAQHLSRLRASAEHLAFDLQTTDAALRAQVQDTLDAMPPSTAKERYIRLIVTRGKGDLTLTPTMETPPTRIVIVRALPELPRELLEQGCVLSTYRVGHPDLTGQDPRAKSGDRRLAVLAESHARASGAYEALRVDASGQVLEGASSTFFCVLDGRIITPPLGVGILAGITRAAVLELCRSEHLPVAEQALFMGDLRRASEAFITGTVRGLLPVKQIDDLVYAAPGPKTRLVSELFALRRASQSMDSGVR